MFIYDSFQMHIIDYNHIKIKKCPFTEKCILALEIYIYILTIYLTRKYVCFLLNKKKIIVHNYWISKCPNYQK